MSKSLRMTSCRCFGEGIEKAANSKHDRMLDEEERDVACQRPSLGKMHLLKCAHSCFLLAVSMRCYYSVRSRSSSRSTDAAARLKLLLLVWLLLLANGVFLLYCGDAARLISICGFRIACLLRRRVSGECFGRPFAVADVVPPLVLAFIDVGRDGSILSRSLLV